MTTPQKRTEVEPPPHRRKTVKRVLITLAVLLGLVVIGITGYWGLVRGGAVDGPPPITQIHSPVPDFASGTTSAPVAAGADGCLGGPSDDPAAQVLAAQAQAPLTPEGAAGFALAFTRYNITSTGDLKLAETMPQLVTPGWLPQKLARATQDNAALIAYGGGTTSTPNAVNDAWRIVTADPSNASITVTVNMIWWKASTEETAQLTGSLILDAVGGHWVAAGYTPLPANPLTPIDGVPWQSYAAVC